VNIIKGEFMENNQIAKDVMEKFRGTRSMLSLSKACGISRITLNAYARGQSPNLGVLLENYFAGTAEGQKLALELLRALHPEIADILPITAAVKRAWDKKVIRDRENHTTQFTVPIVVNLDGGIS
jgi:hypothetical protein